MTLAKDLREFVELLNSKNVEYVIVGAVALAWHGRPRLTGDIDIFVRRSPVNAQRLVDVLDAFGFSGLNVRAADFLEPDGVIQLGVSPNRIDILTGISGCDFEQVWRDRVSGTIGETPAWFLSREHLILNKRSTGRLRDLADLADLGE